MSSCVFCTSCEIFCCGFDNIQIQRTWTLCLHGPDHVNEKFFLFFVLDMVLNKVQFSQLVINEYVQLWYQLLIQIILYHGNPN